MKKLLLVYLIFASLHSVAQSRQTISVAVGASGFRGLYGNWFKSSARSKDGWEAGLDYHFGLTERWDLKAGIHYHQSVLVEFSHSQKKGWLYLLGTRLYFSPPKTWRWYAEGELGLTRLKEEYDIRYGSDYDTNDYATAGLGLGLQWWPPERRIGVFIQPLMRYLNYEQFNHAAIFTVEAGINAMLSKR